MTSQVAAPALYGRAPIGRGTSGVESLLSFLSRLCVRRSALLVDIVDEVLRPHAPSGFFVSRSGLSSFVNSMALRFDSHGEFASVMVAAMEAATMRTGLRSMTLLPWSGVFDERQKNSSPLTVGKHRHWCAACFATWAEQGAALREPLLWRLRAVTRCPEHGTPLRHSCLRCGARQGPVALRVPIATCRRCGQLLYEDSDRDVPALDSLEIDERWAHSRSLTAARMLEAAQSRSPSREGFAPLLRFALGVARERGLTKRQLAFSLGLSAPTFYDWCEQRSFPSLAASVDVSLQLGADPLEVMFSGFNPDDRTWPPTGDTALPGLDAVWDFALRARERASERRHPDWAHALDVQAASSTPVHLHSYAESLGTCKAVLETEFPLRYARVRAVRLQHDSALKADARERARVALERAIAAGGTVTRFKTARWASMTGSDLEVHCPDLYARLCQLLDARIACKDPELIRRGHQALEVALCTPGGLTSSEVARSLGVTATVLKRACPEAWRKLVEHRRAERRIRRAKVRAALKAELTRSSPRSTPSLARFLGVHLTDLQDHPDLYPRLLAKRRALRATVERQTERNRAARSASQAKRRQLIARLDAALHAELRSASPRSAYAIAVLHGTDSSFARRFCPAYWPLVELRRL